MANNRMQWEIQLHRNQLPSHGFVEKIVHLITDAGYEFGAGPYPARYSIIGPSSRDDIHYMGKDEAEDIDAILEKFRDFDPVQTSITIYFARREEPHIPFALAVLPRRSIDATLVSFQVQDSDIRSESEFDSLLDLCQMIFSSFDFSFGGYSDENNPPIPDSVEELLTSDRSRFFFLSETAADTINRDALDSAPIEDVRRPDDSSLIIIISKLDAPSGSQLQAVKEQLVR